MVVSHGRGSSGQEPENWHRPLLVGSDGRRLAKRHGDTRLSYYREIGGPAQGMLALLARWCGLNVGDAITAAELIKVFAVTRLPKSPTIFTSDIDAWLRNPK